MVSFIGRYLGLSPDQGDRPFEVLFLVVLVGIISVLAWHFFHKLSDKDLLLGLVVATTEPM